MTTFLIVALPVLAAILTVVRTVTKQWQNTDPLHICTMVMVKGSAGAMTVFTIVTELVPLLIYLWVNRQTKLIYDKFKISQFHQSVEKRASLKVNFSLILHCNQRKRVAQHAIDKDACAAGVHSRCPHSTT